MKLCEKYDQNCSTLSLSNWEMTSLLNVCLKGLQRVLNTKICSMKVQQSNIRLKNTIFTPPGQFQSETTSTMRDSFKSFISKKLEEPGSEETTDEERYKEAESRSKWLICNKRKTPLRHKDHHEGEERLWHLLHGTDEDCERSHVLSRAIVRYAVQNGLCPMQWKQVNANLL